MRGNTIIRRVLLFVLAWGHLSAGVLPGFGADVTPPATGEPPLTDILLVLDNSGSMKKNDPNFLMRDVVARSLDGFGEYTRIGMISFDQAVRLVEPLSPMTGLTDRARFLQSLESIDYKGRWSDSPGAIEKAIYELKTDGRKDAGKVIIMLTDGIVDTGDKTKDIEKARWLKNELTLEATSAGIQIFGIAFTDRADFSLIQTIAIKTGGDYFRALAAADIHGIFGKIFGKMKAPIRPAVIEKTVDDASLEKPAPPPRISKMGDRERSVAEQAAKDDVSKNAAPTPAKTESVHGEAPSAATPSNSAPEATLQTDQWRRASGVLIGVLVVLGIMALFLIGRWHRQQASIKAGAASGGSSGSARSNPRAALVDIYKITGTRTVEFLQRALKIGRDESNDVVIPVDTISSFHAVIEHKDGFYYLEDQGSKNKTFLNGDELRPYDPRKLKSGDVIHFSKFKFAFNLPDVIPAGNTVMDFTTKVSAVAGTSAMARRPGAVQSEPLKKPKAMLIDAKNVTGRKTINLDGSVVKIGRGAHNDIVIPQKSISGSHAVIEFKGGEIFLEDQRSTNRTRLNGEEIKPHVPVKLKSGDEITFDAYTFIFLIELQTPAGDTVKNG